MEATEELGIKNIGEELGIKLIRKARKNPILTWFPFMFMSDVIGCGLLRFLTR